MLPVFVIAGPTASGKTSCAIKVVEALRKKGADCEIVNADSIQLYKDLKILTAFPTREELSRARHHLFGVLEPFDLYSVAKWKEIAELMIDKLHKEGKIPILCGGTGFYLNSIISGIASIPEVPESHRLKVKERFDQIGRERFVEELFALDPSSKLNKDDTQRILRSYEVITFTGKPLVYWWGKSNYRKYSNIKSLVLLPNRELICNNIRIRCGQMIEAGAIDEVKEFLNKYPDYQGPLDRVIGLLETKMYLNNEISKEELIEKIVIRTRQYAKRQSTWFRHQMKNAVFCEVMTPELIDNFEIKS